MKEKSTLKDVANNYLTHTKGNSGITLIALVITVIVLIILAGVTISLVVGDDGIITKAKEAKQNMTNASAEEEELMQNMLNEMNEIESGIGGGTIEPPDPPKDPTDPENWDKEKVPEVVTEGDRHAPIPKGYVVSKADGEKTIENGLVIYEGTEDVTNDNVAEAQKTRNQYVWIPVDEINDMVMCKSKTADSQCNIIKVEDSESPNGFKLRCSTHNSEDLAGKLYDSTPKGTGGGVYSATMDFSQTNQSYNHNSGRREPAVVTGNNSGDGDQFDNASNNYHGLGNAQNLLNQMNNDFIEMVKSVYTYGGFYVGRYEVGAEGATKREQTVLNNSSSSGNMWYGLYKIIRHKATAEEVVNKDMIWRKPV